MIAQPISEMADEVSLEKEMSSTLFHLQCECSVSYILIEVLHSYPPNVLLKSNLSKILFSITSIWIYQTILKFYAEHGSITDVLCVTFRNDFMKMTTCPIRFRTIRLIIQRMKIVCVVYVCTSFHVYINIHINRSQPQE